MLAKSLATEYVSDPPWFLSEKKKREILPFAEADGSTDGDPTGSG
jgi:hypothetical protein